MKHYQTTLATPASVATGPRTRRGYFCERGPLDGPAEKPAQFTGGYLNDRGTRLDEGCFATLRVYPCHKFEGRHGRALIDHHGWFTDDDGTRETIYGIVARLPHARGFLAGWTMGPSMCATIARAVFTEERDAVYAADALAQRAAEDECEYQRKYQAARDLEDLHARIAKAREEHSELASELPCARLSHDIMPAPASRRAIIARLYSLRSVVRDAARAARELVKDYGPEIADGSI